MCQMPLFIMKKISKQLADEEKKSEKEKKCLFRCLQSKFVYPEKNGMELFFQHILLNF